MFFTHSTVSTPGSNLFKINWVDFGWSAALKEKYPAVTITVFLNINNYIFSAFQELLCVST